MKSANNMWHVWTDSDSADPVHDNPTAQTDVIALSWMTLGSQTDFHHWTLSADFVLMALEHETHQGRLL